MYIIENVRFIRSIKHSSRITLLLAFSTKMDLKNRMVDIIKDFCDIFQKMASNIEEIDKIEERLIRFEKQI